MIFACELNTENLIGTRPARANATNVSFFASRTQFQNHENHLIMYMPCPIQQALRAHCCFVLEKAKRIFSVFFSVFFFSFFFDCCKSFFYSDEHFFMTFSVCAVLFCVFVSVLPFVVFFVLIHEYRLSCHVISLSVRHSNKMNVCIVIFWKKKKKQNTINTQKITTHKYITNDIGRVHGN